MEMNLSDTAFVHPANKGENFQTGKNHGIINIKAQS